MLHFSREVKNKYVNTPVDIEIEHCYKILSENDNLYEVHEQVSCRLVAVQVLTLIQYRIEKIYGC
jgi:hypothetical protein